MQTYTEKLESLDDSLKGYYDHIKLIPLLTFEEELDLSKRIQNGDENARTKLIQANLRLVIKIARLYSTQDMPLIDLIQEGNLGLMKAAERYDHARNVRFSTYASWWIKQSITRALGNKKRTIRIPHRKEESLRRIQKSINSLSQVLSRHPTYAEISQETGISTPHIKEIIEMSSQMISLDAETQTEAGSSLMDIYEDNTYAPDAQISRDCVREKTLEVLERLMDKEKQILMYRFEFFGGKKYTLKTIGEKMGISPETVRQIEIRALNKLKEDAEELKEYVYG